MTITIELRCPRCNDNNLARNGKKRNGTQNYLCNACGRQFIRDDQRTYIGTLLCVTGLIKIMLARGCGIRDIAAILRISVQKVLKTLTVMLMLNLPFSRQANKVCQEHGFLARQYSCLSIHALCSFSLRSASLLSAPVDDQ